VVAIGAPVHAATVAPSARAAAAASSAMSKKAAAATRVASAPSTGASRQLADISNPRVDKWVHRFSTSLKDEIGSALKRGGAYQQMIGDKLAARGMPRELVYLAMIESEFKPRARSRTAAVGLWQFMAGTARQFGLTIHRHVDERTNPSKETDAALTYLSQLHDRFGSWYLAAAAYNAGPGAVSSALHRVLGRSSGTDADFYKISSHLPAETRDYVPKIIAAARIAKQPARYGLPG
jgi:membrane-bound lytic murein transglycosylase D